MTEPKRFTSRTQSIAFTVDEDVFRTRAGISGGAMLQLGELQDKMEGASNVEKGRLTFEVMRGLLDAESFALFEARFYAGTGRVNEDDFDEPVNPIDMSTFFDVIKWLMSELTARPTESSEQSSTP